MAKCEVDTDSGTVKKIEEDGGGCLTVFIILLIIGALAGDGSEDKINYWNGDKNCLIFTERNDGSMVVFKKGTAREVDKWYSNGDKLIVCKGYEVDSYGSYREYGYGFFYNKSDKFYEVIYPQTLQFPYGERFTIKNDYQINVLKVMINAASKYDKLKVPN